MVAIFHAGGVAIHHRRGHACRQRGVEELRMPLQCFHRDLGSELSLGAVPLGFGVALVRGRHHAGGLAPISPLRAVRDLPQLTQILRREHLFQVIQHR